jgi:uncharacterized protein with HEPN domain
MPPREPVALLTDALAQIDDLLAKAARSSLADLIENRDLQAIFERRFEVLGEALRWLERSDPLVFARVVGGAQAIALRNFIAHGYDGVDHRVLWDTVAEDLPAMRTSIARLLENEARDS